MGPGPGSGPGPWSRVLGRVGKKSKSKIILRRATNVSGRPVCPNRSVSASHYDRTDFRLTQNSKPHIKERVRLKILEKSENPNLPNLDPYYSTGMSLFPMSGRIFHLEIQMRFESPDDPSVALASFLTAPPLVATQHNPPLPPLCPPGASCQ